MGRARYDQYDSSAARAEAGWWALCTVVEWTTVGLTLFLALNGNLIIFIICFPFLAVLFMRCDVRFGSLQLVRHIEDLKELPDF